MKTLLSTGFRFVLGTLIVILGCHGFALASVSDGVTPVTPGGLADPTLYLPLVIAIFGFAGAALRRYTPTAGFWHTGLGHVAITFLGAVIGALGAQLQQTGFNRTALVGAAIGAVSAFVGALKPSSSDAAATAGKLTLLPFMLIGALSLSACATAGGQALGACELGSLPQTAEAILVEVVAIIANSATWSADLVDLGKGLTPGQLACIMKALAAGGGVKATKTSAQAATVRLRAQEWLDSHKIAAEYSNCEGVDVAKINRASHNW